MKRDIKLCILYRQYCLAVLKTYLKRSYCIPVKSDPNYYEILGLEKDANIRQIKHAYVKQSKKYHPDNDVGDKSLHSHFIKVNEAYSVLSNKQQRIEYDNRHGFAPINQMQGATFQNPFGVNNYSTEADAYYYDKYDEWMQENRYTSNKHRDYNFTRERYAESSGAKNRKFFGYLIIYMLLGAAVSFTHIGYSHRKYKEYIEDVSEKNNQLYEEIIKTAKLNGPLKQLEIFKERHLKENAKANGNDET